MTKQEKLISNTYSEQDDELFVSEQCCICEDEMVDPNDIYITVDEDSYIHLSCARKHNIQVVKCLELGFGEDY